MHDWRYYFEMERADHLRTHGEVIELQSELQDLERKYKRLREYTQAAMAREPNFCPSCGSDLFPLLGDMHRVVAPDSLAGWACNCKPCGWTGIIKTTKEGENEAA